MRKKTVKTVKTVSKDMVLIRSVQKDIKVWKNANPKFDIEFGSDPVLVRKDVAEYLMDKFDGKYVLER